MSATEPIGYSPLPGSVCLVLASSVMDRLKSLSRHTAASARALAGWQLKKHQEFMVWKSPPHLGFSTDFASCARDCPYNASQVRNMAATFSDPANLLQNRVRHPRRCAMRCASRQQCTMSLTRSGSDALAIQSRLAAMAAKPPTQIAPADLQTLASLCLCESAASPTTTNGTKSSSAGSLSWPGR